MIVGCPVVAVQLWQWGISTQVGMSGGGLAECLVLDVQKVCVTEIAIFPTRGIAILQKGTAKLVMVKRSASPRSIDQFFMDLTVASTLPLLWGYLGDEEIPNL